MPLRLAAPAHLLHFGLRLFLRPLVLATVLATACVSLHAQSSAGVTPILDGSSYNLSTGYLYGTFGYTNTNGSTSNIPVGGSNFFNPGPINQGQPVSFLSGTYDNVFTSSGIALTQVSWSIGTTTVTATKANATAYVPVNTSFTQSSGSASFPVYQGKSGSTFNVTGGTFTASGTATLDTGALLNVNGGTFTTPTLTSASGSTLNVASGTLAVTANLANTGTVGLSGGTLSTPQLVNQPGGTLAVQSGTNSSINSLQNLGTVTGTGGNLALASFITPGTVNWQSGALTAPSIANSGTFVLGGGSVTLTGGFTNTGGLRMTGGTLSTSTLSTGGFIDWSGGTIALTGGGLATDGTSFLGTNPTLGPGQTLQLAGSTTIGSGHFLTINPTAALSTQGGTNSGTLYVTGGTLTSASGVFTNSPGATLYATAAKLAFTGTGVKSTTVGLQNHGTLTLVDTTVSGDVNSPAGSAVNVAGNVTFTGLFSGAANFAGSGTAIFAGGYAPHDSPNLVTYAGNLTLASTNTLFMELGGLTRGTGYDALNVGGTLAFGGTLQVNAINGFSAAAGNTFNLFAWNSATGTFSQVNLPTLAAGLSWDTSQLYTTGILSVSAIPEPSCYAALVGGGAFGLALLRRRRNRPVRP